MSGDQGKNALRLERLQNLQLANAALKTTLANELGTPAARISLEHAEYFQTQFLHKDAAISLMRHELAARGNGESETGPTAFSGEAQLEMDAAIQEMENGWVRLKEAYMSSLAEAGFSSAPE